MIVESTYGTSLHGPREARERAFIDKVVATVSRKGRVLIPIVAIGRAQVCMQRGGGCLGHKSLQVCCSGWAFNMQAKLAVLLVGLAGVALWCLPVAANGLLSKKLLLWIGSRT